MAHRAVKTKMQISTLTKRANLANGFTLVEMMVVVFLLGLASAAVILSFPVGNNVARSEAEMLAARIAAVRDEAVMQSRAVAIWTRPSGYGFELRVGDQWEPYSKGAYQVHHLKDDMRIAPSSIARISFDQTGLPSGPAEIELIHGSGRSKVSISASGEVSVER